MRRTTDTKKRTDASDDKDAIGRRESQEDHGWERRLGWCGKVIEGLEVDTRVELIRELTPLWSEEVGWRLDEDREGGGQ